MTEKRRFIFCAYPALTHFVALRVRPQGLTYDCGAPPALWGKAPATVGGLYIRQRDFERVTTKTRRRVAAHDLPRRRSLASVISWMRRMGCGIGWATSPSRRTRRIG